MNYSPKISIVTPSYNQGQFLEETIQSVLGQCYPNLEYIIMDGGSTDNSVEIIKKYEKHLAYWTSEKDGGQSAAINTGFKRATGEILGWLNSDDMYLPGALQYIATCLDPAKTQIVFGNCMHIREGSTQASGSDVAAVQKSLPLYIADYVIQPSAFWTRRTWESVGELDQNMHFGFDWEWFLRAEQMNVSLTPLKKYLSIYRMHEAHKTGSGGESRQREMALIYEKYAGPAYRDFYLECCRSGEAVYAFVSCLYRLKLGKIKQPFLWLKFPHIFRGRSENEAWTTLNMR